MAYIGSVDEHQALMDKERSDHSNTKEMQKRNAIITKTVDQCHHAATVFKTSYSVILSPKFAANKGMLKRKAGGGGLSKEWKGNISRMRHAGHLVKLVRKVGILGKVITRPTEACSTMKCPYCPTLHHPGRHWLHHCPNKKCQKVTVRDECAREISNFADARILIHRYYPL
jgi:hypothetical protein